MINGTPRAGAGGTPVQLAACAPPTPRPAAPRPPSRVTSSWSARAPPVARSPAPAPPAACAPRCSTLRPRGCGGSPTGPGPRSCPPSCPASAVAVRARGRAVALSERELGWEYSVLDVPGLRAHLDAGLADVSARVGRAAGVGPDGVLLVDGSLLPARVVVDAGGYRQPLRAAPGRVRASAEQTAYGVIVDEGTAAPVVAPGEAHVHGLAPCRRLRRLADLPLRRPARRRPRAARGDLAGPPAGPCRSTSCASGCSPGWPAHGVIPDPDVEVERVHFPVDSPRHPDAPRMRSVSVLRRR